MADSGQRKQYDGHGSSYVGEYFVRFLVISGGTRVPGGEAPRGTDGPRAVADVASPPRAVARVPYASQLCAERPRNVPPRRLLSTDSRVPPAVAPRVGFCFRFTGRPNA